MNLEQFIKANVSDGDKNKFLNAFNDPLTKTKMA